MTTTKKASAEERYKMIEEAAYYIAERNGFQGDSNEYWAQAEKEVNALLKKKTKAPAKKTAAKKAPAKKAPAKKAPAKKAVAKKAPAKKAPAKKTAAKKTIKAKKKK